MTILNGGTCIAKQNGLMYCDTQYIRCHLSDSQPCEVCNISLIEHEWVELNENGMVDRCSVRNTYPSENAIPANIVMMVAYHANGGVVMEIEEFVLQGMLERYVNEGLLALDCWELRVNPWNKNDIDARLSPSRRFDGKDNNWRTWEYTFMRQGQ